MCCGGGGGAATGAVLVYDGTLSLGAGTTLETGIYDWPTRAWESRSSPTFAAREVGCEQCGGGNVLTIWAHVASGVTGSPMMTIADYLTAGGQAGDIVEQAYISPNRALSIHHIPTTRATQAYFTNPYAAGPIVVEVQIWATTGHPDPTLMGRFRPRASFFQPNAGAVSANATFSSQVYHSRGALAAGTPGSNVIVETIDDGLFDFTVFVPTASAGAFIAIDGASDAAMTNAIRWYQQPAAGIGTYGSQVANAVTVPSGATAVSGSPLRSAFPFNRVSFVNGIGAGTAQGATFRMAVVGGQR